MKYNQRLFIIVIFCAAVHIAACTQQRIETIHSAAGKPLLAGRAFAYDGDSIFFGSAEVRLDAIDAPERDQACRDGSGKFWPCGIVARDALRQLIKGNTIYCRIEGKDKYKRLLGICYAQGRDLNALMVKGGLAVAYHYFSEAYAPQESYARARSLGIWEDASFTEPYYCRHLTAGHTCYEYDYIAHTGRIAEQSLIGKSRAVDAPG